MLKTNYNISKKYDIEQQWLKKQVINSKYKLPLNMNFTKKDSHYNDEDIDIYFNREKITNNKSNKYTDDNKDMRHDNDNSSLSTLSIHSLSKRNNQELIEKELRTESDISLH